MFGNTRLKKENTRLWGIVEAQDKTICELHGVIAGLKREVTDARASGVALSEERNRLYAEAVKEVNKLKKEIASERAFGAQLNEQRSINSIELSKKLTEEREYSTGLYNRAKALEEEVTRLTVENEELQDRERDLIHQLESQADGEINKRILRLEPMLKLNDNHVVFKNPANGIAYNIADLEAAVLDLRDEFDERLETAGQHNSSEARMLKNYLEWAAQLKEDLTESITADVANETMQDRIVELQTEIALIEEAVCHEDFKEAEGKAWYENAKDYIEFLEDALDAYGKALGFEDGSREIHPFVWCCITEFIKDANQIMADVHDGSIAEFIATDKTNGLRFVAMMGNEEMPHPMANLLQMATYVVKMNDTIDSLRWELHGIEADTAEELNRQINAANNYAAEAQTIIDSLQRSDVAS